MAYQFYTPLGCGMEVFMKIAILIDGPRTGHFPGEEASSEDLHKERAA